MGKYSKEEVEAAAISIIEEFDDACPEQVGQLDKTVLMDALMTDWEIIGRFPCGADVIDIINGDPDVEDDFPQTFELIAAFF